MIINKNSVNTCIFTLSERTTLDPVYYLFEFSNTQDNATTVKVFTATDISTNKLRNNEFEIEETESEDLLNGKVNLELTGSWTYKIYEQSSSINLDVSLAGALVENGRIDVLETETIDTPFEEESNIKVFND